MKNTPIRFLVVLGTLSMVAILVVQVYWVSEAINKQEEQFNRSVQMALRNVVESLCELNGNDIPSSDPIDQLSNNYFIARTNYKIDLSSLDYLLKAELQKRGIAQDYEYGVYDCQTDRMVYGDFVSMQDQNGKTKPTGKLPKLVNDEYYFGIYFPGKTAGIVSSLGIWQLTSLLTLLILIFFTYALFVILKQKRLSEIQRDFINNMTHEFKTPLATLQVSAEVLENEASGERQKKYARIMRSELGRLDKHVHQLLETSVLDYDKTKAVVPIRVKAVLDRVAEPFRALPGIQWNEKINLTDECTISGDPAIFETIVFNLLDNAAKYGESLIRLTASKEAGLLEVKVSNDGREIPRKERTRIFRKFYRIHQGDLHDVKGFGLGLYFVRQGARSMHGKVTVVSSPDLTTFTLTFPKAS
jgi:two-component system phosphate regulon sensor histidine kinase PhoR